MYYFEETNDLNSINSSFDLVSRGEDELTVELFFADCGQHLSYHMNGPNEGEPYTFNLVFHNVIHINMPMEFQISSGDSFAVRGCEIIKPLLDPYCYEVMSEELFSSQNSNGYYKTYCLLDGEETFLNSFVLCSTLTGKWLPNS